MADQTTRSRVPVEVAISDNLPSSRPSDKTALIVLGSVLGFVVLAVLYYQAIGI